MTELRGVESASATDLNPDPRCQYVITNDHDAELKPGDDVLLLVGDPSRRREEYGVPLRITDKSEPGDNEVVLQLGDRLVVAQKIPEFI